MPYPDVELTHAEAGHVYYQGKVYDLRLMATGWQLSRESPIYEGETIEDCSAWLMAQVTN